MARTSIILAGLLWLTGSSLVYGQKTVTKGNVVTTTATIQAIESSTRRIALRDEKGEEDTFVVGPEVARFNELKVGDKVRMTYYESLVFQLLRPGQKADPASDEAAFNRAKSARPAGTLATQEKRTVTVKAVDSAAPSVTVTTEDGRTITRKVDDKKNLEGIKPGDRIEITYTQALLSGIERAK